MAKRHFYLVFVWAVAALANVNTSSGAEGGMAVDPLDWPHWRGPEMNGISREKNLPSSWSPKGENLLWRNEEIQTRSAPVSMNGKLYAICRSNPETPKEGEMVVCLNPETGEIIWKTENNVFLSDAPAERVGWASVVADPESGNVYSLGLGCYLQCLDGATGKRLWQHSMSEEYGMLSTYGGRTNFPLVFDDLVIISGVMTGWGDYAIPAHRFAAFDKKTGDAVWIASTRLRPNDTTYSSPVLTVFDGQAAMVVGAGDGAFYAFQPRTGKEIWKYQASTRGINTAPLVVDNIVYAGHSEQNADDPTVLGAIFAFDGRAAGEIPEDKLLWKVKKKTVGRSAPLLADGRLYMLEDGAKLLILDPKTGKPLAKDKRLGRIMMGSMLYADGKIYVGEMNGIALILKPTEDGVEELHRVRLNNEEIHGSFIASHGRVYLPTSAALYCLGVKDAKPSADPLPEREAEKAVSEDEKIAHIQVTPVEIMIKPGESKNLVVRAYNSNGQFLKNVPAEFTVEGGGQVDSEGVYSPPPAMGQPAVATITAKVEELTSVARVRVIPNLPWTFDFNDGKIPPIFIGVANRHKPVEVDGEKAIVKISTIPLGARSQSWLGWPDLSDYTVQADFKATAKAGNLPDMGLINQRYTLDMMGAAQQLQLRSWTPRLELRFAKTVPFKWEGEKWYTMKFRGENKDGKAVLKGKIWPRGEKEPAKWQIEAADATPNVTGSPGMFGNAQTAEFYIDNVSVTKN